MRGIELFDDPVYSIVKPIALLGIFSAVNLFLNLESSLDGRESVSKPTFRNILKV